MKVSRRGLFAGGGVAGVAVAMPALAQGSGHTDLVTQTVARLSWMFPQPDSANTNMGFGLRRMRMHRRLETYLGWFQRKFGRQPTPDHLLAAGAAVYHHPNLMKNLGWPTPPFDEEARAGVYAWAERRQPRV
ncbi:MAG: hypothetical protein KGO51_10080 [Alphaproteobacteria bacterium]|nr:hypothetical protein [Alphaproteobacteria bacterium]